MISLSSTSTSSTPPTSSNLTPVISPVISFALLLPIDITPDTRLPHPPHNEKPDARHQHKRENVP